jgi:hypothetical protein
MPLRFNRRLPSDVRKLNLIGQGFRKRKIRTHIVSFVNGMHKRKIYKSRGTSVFVKNDILSLNIGVILFLDVKVVEMPDLPHIL